MFGCPASKSLPVVYPPCEQQSSPLFEAICPPRVPDQNTTVFLHITDSIRAERGIGGRTFLARLQEMLGLDARRTVCTIALPVVLY